MNQGQLTFLFELLMSREEKFLFSAILANPRDQATRNEYIDYLIENGRLESAEYLNKNPDETPIGIRNMTVEEMDIFVQREMERGVGRLDLSAPAYSSQMHMSSGYASVPPIMDGRMASGAIASQVYGYPPLPEVAGDPDGDEFLESDVI